MSKTLELNCDMGESFGAWNMGNDLEILPYIDAANIACGFHGGDPAVMRKTVAAALKHHVALGAHPGVLQGLPQGFGILRGVCAGGKRRLGWNNAAGMNGGERALPYPRCQHPGGPSRWIGAQIALRGKAAGKVPRAVIAKMPWHVL